MNKEQIVLKTIKFIDNAVVWIKQLFCKHDYHLGISSNMNRDVKVTMIVTCIKCRKHIITCEQSKQYTGARSNQVIKIK
jgi:hydroxymethylglutaryl-CoA reductase